MSCFLSIDTNAVLQENLLPVPLKHSTETAYMLVLGLAICIAGIAAALLPAIPVGTKYWAILLTLSVLYPLALTRSFKTNRADYEFRVLHWFPAGIFIVWFVLQLLSPRIEIIRILSLGFFFLWSLPLVALGIAFIIIFAVHVLRRSRSRVTVLSLFLAIFILGAVYAEAAGLNPRLQASVYPKNPPTLAVLQTAFTHLRAILSEKTGTSGMLVAMEDTSSSSLTSSASQSFSSASSAMSKPTKSSVATIATQTSSMSSSVSSSIMMPTSFSSSTSRAASALPPVIGEKNPGHLAQSGPESAAVLGATLLAAYFGLLHARAKKRV